MPALKSQSDLIAWHRQLQEQQNPDMPSIIVCAGTGCSSMGAHAVIEKLEAEAKKRDSDIKIKSTGCHGFCERGPLVVMQPSKVFYNQVKTSNVPSIFDALQNDSVAPELLYIDPQTGQPIEHEYDVRFYKEQQRMALANNGRVDPREIDDFIALGGYSALAKTLTELSPAEVVESIKRSGLRGRGGAGFPTGRKWEIATNNISALRAQAGTNHKGNLGYVICNGDEGDPGAFMDRSILEGNPHGVLEGLIIGAYALGVNQGYFYIRDEYPLAIENVELAIERAHAYGLLGENILGSNFSFTATIQRGSGAFVCGEETALIASIEGERGMPRSRPPYPAQSGLWGKPTIINNVKTWTFVPLILQNGVEWFKNIGTPTSPGTAIFSLVGKVNNTGLVEVPMGISLRRLVNDIGGGVLGDKKLKAVQSGGPSGGCIPEHLLDTPVEYEAMLAVGSMMGSGGLVVMDESTCMVDIARYFLTFTQSESCGKCVPCRLGTKRMLEILTRITAGHGKIEDLDLLEELAASVKVSSLCGLGQSAPNPVLTTLKYFRDEYEAHILEGRCPAGQCKALITYSIDPHTCEGCMVCLRACPTEAITGARREVHVIDPNLCTRCDSCRQVCKFDAVLVA